MMRVLSSSSKTTGACLYDVDDNSQNEYIQPLLVNSDDDDDENEQEQSSVHSKQVRMIWRLMSIWIGVLFGIFFQSCYLLMQSYVSNTLYPVYYKGSFYENIILSIIWTSMVCILSLTALTKLRSIISNEVCNVAKDDMTNTRKMDEYMLSIERCFVTGLMTGLCGAWIIANLILGFQAYYIYSVFILIVAFTCCRFITLCFSSSDDDDDNDNSNSDLV